MGAIPEAIFSVRARRQHGIALVSLVGELDVAGTPHLEQRMTRIAQDGGGVVLDLEGLTFLDCSGLRTLLSVRHEAERHARPFAFIGGSPAVRRVFSLTGNEELLDADAGRALFEFFTWGVRPTVGVV